MREIRIAICAFGLGCAAWGQSFEAASVKPDPPSGDGRIRIVMSGGPGTSDPGRLNWENVTLKDVLAKAFDVKSYQLTVPAWADSERFDITAKIPPGATKAQLGTMLQNLLADRFRMTFHREKKELAAFVLVVGKNGPKLKESEASPADAAKDDAGPPPSPPGVGRRMEMGKDGFPVPPKGRGNYMMMMPGKARLTANGMSISELLDMLANQVDRPVVDETGLKGKYDFTLEFAPEMRNMPGMPMMMAGRGPGGETPPETEPAPSLFTAVQEQLGLKLDARKAAVDMVVIDHLEKNATEN